MHSKQIEQKIREGIPGKFNIDKGLYLKVLGKDSGHFVVRYSFLKKRREITLGKFSNRGDGLTLSEAREHHLVVKQQLRSGVDPLLEKHKSQSHSLTLVNDIAIDWLQTCDARLENPQIPRRVYSKDIAPEIGQRSLTSITPPDILNILRKIKNSGRPSIANDALSYLKQLFDHAFNLGLITNNPASRFKPRDAGGQESSRTRALSLKELETVFEVMRENKAQFTRDNYLAIILLICLGVRKTELTAARWSEFNLDELVWTIPKERTKTKSEIRIPLSELILPIFEELKIRGCGSEFLFPSRRSSKRRDYISDDTINHALANLFGKSYKKLNQHKLTNKLGGRGIEHFTVHDLRRTFRSLLAENKVPHHIAERCLNHKIRGVAGVYDRYDYFDERKEAMQIIAKLMLPITLNM